QHWSFESAEHNPRGGARGGGATSGDQVRCPTGCREYGVAGWNSHISTSQFGPERDLPDIVQREGSIEATEEDTRPGARRSVSFASNHRESAGRFDEKGFIVRTHSCSRKDAAKR